METPDTRAGRFTAQAMRRVKKKLPEISTHDYNRVYEAVWETAIGEVIVTGEKNFHPSVRECNCGICCMCAGP